MIFTFNHWDHVEDEFPKIQMSDKMCMIFADFFLPKWPMFGIFCVYYLSVVYSFEKLNTIIIHTRSYWHRTECQRGGLRGEWRTNKYMQFIKNSIKFIFGVENDFEPSTIFVVCVCVCKRRICQNLKRKKKWLTYVHGFCALTLYQNCKFAFV